MEDAPNGVEVITHRAVSRLREQNDFAAGLNSNCTGKLIAHRDGFGLPIVQVTASYYLALKCGDISFAIGVDPQKLLADHRHPHGRPCRVEDAPAASENGSVCRLGAFLFDCTQKGWSFLRRSPEEQENPETELGLVGFPFPRSDPFSAGTTP